jgi:hypothetical protein
MTTSRQIEANRRNARHSTGPRTDEGKQRSRRNAVRHGLTAETVISALEDADDYSAFEAAVIADYDAQSAVERELVLRLASLLWRIRRATTVETGLFEIQARHLLAFRATREARETSDTTIYRLFGPLDPNEGGVGSASEHITGNTRSTDSRLNAEPSSTEIAQSFLRLANLLTYPLDRLSRYEATLWRQADQTIFALEALHRRKPWEKRSRLRPSRRQEWSAHIQDDD